MINCGRRPLTIIFKTYAWKRFKLYFYRKRDIKSHTHTYTYILYPIPRDYTSKFFIVQKRCRGRITGFYQRFRSKCKKCRSLDDIWLLNFAARRRLWKYESTSMRSNNSYPSFLLLLSSSSSFPCTFSCFFFCVISRYCSQPRFSILRVHPSSSTLPGCLDTASVAVATQQSYPHEMFEIISRL